MSNIFSRIIKRAKSDRPNQFFLRILKALLIASTRSYLDLKYSWIKELRTGFGQPLIRNILGNRFLLNPSDHGLSRDLVLFKNREPYSTKFFKDQIKEGMVVVDIGANLGYYALLEAKMVGDQGKIYAFEPVPLNHRFLTKNVKINHYQNLEVLPLAVGNQNRKGLIYLSNKYNLSSLRKSQNRQRKYFAKVPVQIITLDSFFQNRLLPRIIRMDVEGFELEIIKGMERILKSGQPLLLFIEVHLPILGKQVKDLFQILERHNFKIKAVFNEPSPTIRSLLSSRVLKPLFDYLTKQTDRNPYTNKYGLLELDFDDPISQWPQRRCLEIFFERTKRNNSDD